MLPSVTANQTFNTAVKLIYVISLMLPLSEASYTQPWWGEGDDAGDPPRRKLGDNCHRVEKSIPSKTLKSPRGLSHDNSKCKNT